MLDSGRIPLQKRQMDPATQVTRLLLDLKNGDPAAVDRLMPIVYDELRRLAAHYLRDEHAAATLQPTALVHEAYLRLVAQADAGLGITLAFLRRRRPSHAPDPRRPCPAAPTARNAAAVRHRRRSTMSSTFAPMKSDDIVALDDALTALAAVDARKCKVIELRFFGGLSVDETARALNVSVGTIGREQRMAEAWLHRELSRRDA